MQLEYFKWWSAGEAMEVPADSDYLMEYG